MSWRLAFLAAGIAASLSACGGAGDTGTTSSAASASTAAASATWREIKTSVAPPPRDSGLGVYDSHLNRFLLAGGRSSCAGTDVTIFTDTWTFDGSAWTELHPSEEAPNLAGFPTAYDDATHQALAVIYQGCAEGSFTAVWNGTTWKVMSNDGSDGQSPSASFVPAPMPPAEGAMAYDPQLRTVILWTPQPPLVEGPSPSNAAGPSMWSWDGSKWTAMNPPQQPPATIGPVTMTWDSATQKLLLYGEHSQQLWSFDGSTWTRVRPTASPPARVGASFIDDPALGTVLLYGGSTPESYSPAADPAQGSDQFSPGPPLGDLWSWNGTTWTELHPANSPPPRFFAQMAYDPALSAAVLFGGAVSTTADAGDTWVFGNQGSQSSP